MRRILLAFTLGLLGPCGAWCASTLSGVDVYRSDRITGEDIRRRYAQQLRALMERRNAPVHTKALDKQIEEMQNQIERDVKAAWKLSWVHFVWAENPEADGQRAAYVTIDVVEPKDAEARMPFGRAPVKKFDDPQGLLLAWERYADLGWSLIKSGQLSLERAPCRGFYCPWGEGTPELKAMDEKFAGLVPQNQKFLSAILAQDRDPKRRADAAFLLSYLPSANQAVHVLTPALNDPDVGVRLAVLKIFSDLAVYHPDAYLPIEPLVAAIDYPNTEERGKALAVLVGLADNERYHDYIIRNASDRLLDLLRLRQPINHDLAATVLGLLSKKSIDATDYEGWSQWVASAKSQLSKPPAAR